MQFAKRCGDILRLKVEDLSQTKSAEVITPTASSCEDYSTSRLMNKKIWKNEKRLKKERKKYYAALAEEIGESRKENSTTIGSANSEEAPAWFNNAMEKVLKSFNKSYQHLRELG